MAKDLSKFENVDLSSITLADVAKIKDESLKKTLLDAVRRDTEVASFQQHSNHSDHVTGPEDQVP